MAITRDDFELWLIEMDNELSRLMKALPIEVSTGLNFSVDSLMTLEAWLLGAYSSPSELLSDSNKDILDRSSRYVGETIRKNVGGIWNIDLKNSKNAYFAIPVVQQEGSWTEAPVTMVTAAMDRRTGDYMKGVLKPLLEQRGNASREHR